MLTKIGKRIDELEKEKCKNIPKRNQRAEEYNNLSENALKGFKNRLDKAERQGNGNSPKQGSNKQNTRILKARTVLGDQGE